MDRNLTDSMEQVSYRNVTGKLLYLLLFTVLAFSFSPNANASIEFPVPQAVDTVAGENLFNANCAACHKLYKKATGPALFQVGDKYDRDWLYSWIKNSQDMVKSGDAKANAIYNEYNGAVMTSFPQLSNADIDNIIAYTYTPKKAPAVAAITTATTAANSGGVSNDIILAVLALVFLLLVVMLLLVNKTLRRIAEANGVVYEEKPARTPVWKLFIENQFLVLVTAILFLLASGYFAYGYLMQVGVDQGYEPVQPIHYSHRIHAGDNQIDCNYCHSSARHSKHSGIPSANVCMNCHMYVDGTEIKDDAGNLKYDGERSPEISKIYAAIGWDAEERQYIEDYEQQPIKWVRIHNLPDLAYFNHSQHVNAGQLECQECHGPVETMEEMYQYSELTMGWCINCHRETEVQFEKNGYYQDFHEELTEKYHGEKITAEKIGGLECGKCHY